MTGAPRAAATASPARPSAPRAPYRFAAGVAAATAALAVVDPNSTHVPLCPLHAVTGWWCPLCGGLRAVHALTRGEFAAALHDNAVFVASAPLLVLLWADWAHRSRRQLAPRCPPRAGWLSLIAVGVVFTVLRNLPALSWLAP